MNNSPLVSIILPVYNVEEYLEECLDSVIGQSYENYELIAINDGSTDSSLNILERYQEKLGCKLRIHTQENAGLSAARNKGLDLSHGEYIYFLDSDDWILSDALSKSVTSMEKGQADLVIFNAKAFCDGMSDELLKNAYYTRNLPQNNYSGLSAFEDSILKGNYVVQSCCYMYRKSMLPSLRFLEGILHEDHYFTTMLFFNTKKTIVLEDRFFQRRFRPDSITTSIKTLRHAEGYYISVRELSKSIRELGSVTSAFNLYLGQLLAGAFEVEREARNGAIPMLRKLELYKEFKHYLPYRSLATLFVPSVLDFVRSMMRK